MDVYNPKVIPADRDLKKFLVPAAAERDRPGC